MLRSSSSKSNVSCLLRAFLTERRSSIHEQFMPRRMAFVYDFDEVTDEGYVPDVPTTLRRSKVDCPKVGRVVLWSTHVHPCTCQLLALVLVTKVGAQPGVSCR